MKENINMLHIIKVLQIKYQLTYNSLTQKNCLLSEVNNHICVDRKNGISVRVT